VPQALCAPSGKLVDYLPGSIDGAPSFGTPRHSRRDCNMRVPLQTSAEMTDNSDQGAVVVAAVRDEERLNDPRPTMLASTICLMSTQLNRSQQILCRKI